MIKEATNSFSEGIISDVNPINTPKTALTDCVNGTILTYNGNEYSLQNDMGNFGLKNCKLSEGYVPIGMKEYGGILYIVSYNPVENKTEIGSYPSTKIGVKDGEGNYIYKDIEYIDWTPFKGEKPEGTTDPTYSELLNKYSLQVFTEDKDKDKYKINPGDELKIQQVFFDDYKTDENGNATTEPQDPKYEGDEQYFQKAEFYIMDETRNLTGIDEYISEYIEKNNKTIKELELQEAKWKIPGWLAVKLNFIKFDNFLTDFELTQLPKFKDVDKSSDVKFDLSYRIYMSDGFYVEAEKTPKITVVVKFEGAGSITKPTIDKETGKEIQVPVDEYEILSIQEDDITTLPNGSIYINTVQLPITWNAKKGEKLTITATPYIGEIKYDTYETQYIYTADASVFDADKLEIGSTTFRWKTTSKQLDLEFNTIGAETAVGAKLMYDIYRVDPDNKELTWIPVLENKEVDDWKKASTITTNLTISLVEYTESFNKNKDLVSEDVYKFVFKVVYGGETITRERVVTATELMNDIDEQLYYNITLDQWLPNYEKCIKGEWPVITDAEITPKDEINTDCLWFTNVNNSPVCKMYKGFVKNTDFKYGDTKNIIVSQPYTGTINSISDEITFPHGPIWNNIYARILLSVENRRTADYNINKLGKLILKNKTPFFGSAKNITNYTITYTGNQDLICYDYKINNLCQDKITESEYYFILDDVNSMYGSVSLSGSNNIVRKVFESSNLLTSFEIYNRKTGHAFSADGLKDALSKVFENKNKVIPICVIYPVYRYENGIYWSSAQIEFDGTNIDYVFPPGGNRISGIFWYYKQLLAINTDKYGLFFINAVDRDAKNGGGWLISEIFSIDKEPLITIANGVSEHVNQFSRGKIYNGGFINITKNNTSFNPNIELGIKFQDFRYDFQKYGIKNFSSDEIININIENKTNFNVDESIFDTTSMASKITELDNIIESFNLESTKSSQLRAENSTFYTTDFVKYDTYYFVNNYSGAALSKLEDIVKGINNDLVYTEWVHVNYRQQYTSHTKWQEAFVYGTCLTQNADPILPTDFN